MASTQISTSSEPATASQPLEGDGTVDFGDFVRNEDEELDIEEDAEPWSHYDEEITQHVFYPICVGEVLHGRYLVEHKLGFGGFSTVWMAHDLEDKKDVALKVMSQGAWGDKELYIQEKIVQNVRDTSHLVTYGATFLLSGKKSHHRVLVLPLMGPCAEPLILRDMPMTTRMSAAKQLLMTVENLHQGGIVHRDLSDRNCMWGMAPLHQLGRNAKYEILGRPLKQVIPYIDLWKQGELVRPLRIPENQRTEDFYLGDFGLAMKLGDTMGQHGYPPKEYCSPERLHAQEPSFACDMWSYMMIFAELYLGYVPFHGFFEGGIVTSIFKCLGPLPEEWKGLYQFPKGLDCWYDPTQSPDPKESLVSKIAHFRPDADPAEREFVRSIMLSVLTYHPEKRLTATQLLRDASFRALMEKYDC